MPTNASSSRGSALAQLALRRGRRPTLDGVAGARDALLALRDVMQILRVDLLAGVLLCLRGRSSLDGVRLAREVLLGLGDVRDGLRV